MRHNSRAALVLVAGLLAPLVVQAQSEGRSKKWLQNCERKRNTKLGQFCELRTTTLPPESTISVEGRKNGGVAFYGWDKKEVKVVAMIQANAADDDDAVALAKQVKIKTNGGRIKAEVPPGKRLQSVSVSYDIFVPTQSNLEAQTENGGVSAEAIEGNLDFAATNGGISLANVAGDVRGQTTNGGISATLTGTSWRGKGLDLRTINGGVSLAIPRGYNARLETGTTNGGIQIGLPIIGQGSIGKRIKTQLGSGGPPVRAVTTNGGVKIYEW